MIVILLKRLLSMIPTLFIASVIIFSFIYLIPGDPAAVMLGDQATEEDIQALRIELGLDRPFLTRYLIWLGAALRGDLGNSIFFGDPVLTIIAQGAETSIFLAILAMLLIFCIGIPLGIASAAKNNTFIDQLCSGGAMLAASVPTFWLGLYFILIFAVLLGWLPSSGFPSVLSEGNLSNLRHLILPAITLAIPNSALIIRMVRAEMMDVMHADYVRTARAKGLSESVVIMKHIFRNALIAVVTTLGFTFVTLISEATVTETVFALPGIGRLVVQSILRRDYPVIQGVILIIVVLYMVVNLLVDLLYTWLDPRVKLK